MKILGIDPGIGRTGWGIINHKHGSTSSLIYDCITTKPKLLLEKRLLTLYEEISKIIELNKPNQAAIEKLFFNTNAKTAMSVGHARGVVLLALTKNKIPCFHYTPLQVKIAVTSYGRADKRQIQQMVQTLLKLDEIPKPDDVSDALAIALTHAYSIKIK